MNRLNSLLFGGEDRGVWPRHLQFILASAAFTTGVRPISIAPYFYKESGGDAFLIPYFLFMVLIALPLTFLEFSIGQFNSSGPVRSWRVVPLFQGIGLAMVFASIIFSWYSSQMAAVSFYYLFASFTNKLPWIECSPEWSRNNCDPSEDYKRKCAREGWTILGDFECYNNATRTFIKFERPNETLFIFQRPSTQYFEDKVLRNPDRRDIDDLGPVVWHLALCSLLCWFIIALCLIKSVRSYGKAVYVTSILPLCLLVTFFIYGLTLDGHSEGYRAFTKANMTKIKTDYKAWKNVAGEALFSMSLNFGGLTTLSSYNRFNNDAFRDSVIIWSVNIILSFVGSFTTFFFMGAIATRHNLPVDKVFFTGTYFLFAMMPDFFATTSSPVLWSILWFIMLICLAIGQLLGCAETVVTAILDLLPRLRRLRPIVVIAVCSVLYLTGLPFLTEDGTGMMYWLDIYTFRWGFFMIPVIELISLMIYGIPRFLGDAEIMIGVKTFGFVPVILVKALIGFFLILPTLAAVLFYHVCLQIDDPYTLDWPDWADRLGQAFTWVIPVIIIVGALFSVVYTMVTGQWRKDLCAFLSPPKTWGPALLEHRALVARYIQWFTVNPKENGDGGATASMEMSAQL